MEIATWIENLTTYMTLWQKSQTFKHPQKLEHAMFIQHHEKKFKLLQKKIGICKEFEHELNILIVISILQTK
jgi:hypothetical protein